MGTKWLGELPKTRNWRGVIALLKKTDNPAKVADATSQAAQGGLELAKKDQGVSHVVFMLMDAVWSSRRENFSQGLAEVGMALPAEPSLLDVVGAFDDALDRNLRLRGHRTDLAEMARYSAVDALTDICHSETGRLFGVTIEDTQSALRRYATPERFGIIGQNFFGKFLYRFLDYHLSRELANHIGPGKQFNSISSCENFKNALSLHCHQTARIVKEFAGCWPSATELREGITVENVRTKFVPTAFNKIRGELKLRSGANA
ncbi:MAG: hypothetical protein ACFFCW_20520 [Candidatus Hodarchaeota archaeon]